MINKNQYTVDSDKKVLHKIGKHWAVASTLMLGLAGGAIAAGTVNANADTTTNQPSNSQAQTKATTSNQTVASNGVTVPSTNNNVKTQINNNLDKAYQASQSASNNSMGSSKSNVSKPSSVQSQATNMYRGLLLSATKPSNNSNSSSSSSKPSFNSAYQNYMAKMSGTDAKVASANDNNAENNNNKVNPKKPLLLFSNDAQTKSSDGHWIYDNGQYISSMPSTDNISDGTYDGLTYKYDKTLQALEFTGGTINVSNTNNFLGKSQFGGSDTFYGTINHTLVSAKFDNDVDTSKVTSMSDMFYSDNELQSIDLGNNFDTSNVINMNRVFDGDKSLQSLNLGNKFDTSNVTNMNGMFESDSVLQSLNLGDKFDTSNVTDMNDMFESDSALQSLNLGDKFDTSNVTDMRGMFDDDNHLQSLNLGDKFDTNNVTNMSKMFKNDSALLSLTLPSSFNTSKVSDMSQMFNSDFALQSLNLGDKFDTSNVTNMSDMFDNGSDSMSDYNLQQINIESPLTKFSSDTYLPGTWHRYGDNNNADITKLNDDNSHVGNWQIMVTDDINFNVNSDIDDEIHTTVSGVKGTTGMISAPSGYHFTDGKTQEPITYNKGIEGSYDFNVSNVHSDIIQFHDIYGDVDGFKAPKNIIEKSTNPNGVYMVSDPSGWAMLNSSGGTSDFKLLKYGAGNQVINVAPVYDGLTYKYDKNNNSLEFVNGTASGNLGSLFENLPENTQLTTKSMKSLKSIKFDDNINVNSISDMSQMFDKNLDDTEGFTSLQSIDLGNNFNTSNVTNMSDMFGNDSALQSLKLGNNFDTSNVSDMSGMFDGDSTLHSLTLPSSFDTSNVTNMSQMFDDDENLSTQSIQNAVNKMDTSNVTNMSGMFVGDSSLQSLNLGNKFNTSNVTNMSQMFWDDSNLQSLTLPNSFDTSNVTDMSGMFDGDSTLHSLTLPSSFDTSNVTNMGDMFDDDTSLHALKLGNKFDTSNVTNMEDMFLNDDLLHSLDLGNKFNTSKVTYMDYMFYNDSDLQFLNLGNKFDTSNVTNMSDMFGNKTYRYYNNDDNLQQINIGSPLTKFNSTAKLPYTWRKYSNYTPGITLGENLNNFAPTKLDNGQANHVGDWIIYIKATDKIRFNGDANANTTISGPKGATTTISAPNGYHFTDGKNQESVAYDNGTHTYDVAINDSTDTINFVNPSNNSIGNTTSTGTSNTTFTVPNIPSGYHVTNPSSDKLTYDGQPHTVHVTGNTIKGMATIHLVYNAKDSDGNIHTYSQGADNSKPNYTFSDVITEPIDTQVGDTVTFKPSQFNKPNYSTNDSDWTISFTPSDAPIAENDDFNQGHTFTYTGQEATHQEVRYIDITTGAQVATSGQFSGQYNNQSPIGPVVGIQGVNDIGVVGQNDILEPQVTQGQIKIIYMNEYNINQQIGNTDTVSGDIGSSYNLYQEAYQHVPSGYEVDGYNFAPGAYPKTLSFTQSPQDIYIVAKPLPKPQPQTTKGDIQLVYLNSATDENGHVYNILQVPSGYTLVNNENPVILAKNGVYNVAVQSKSVNDKVEFIDEQNGKQIGSPITSTGSFDTVINTSNLEVPQGYIIDKSNPSNKTLIHNGTTHNVYVKALPNFMNVIEYIDNNGNIVGTTSAYGRQGTDIPDNIIQNNVPSGYSLNQKLPVQFTNNNVVEVHVQGYRNKAITVNYNHTYTDNNGVSHNVSNGSQIVHGNANSDITDKLNIPTGFHLASDDTHVFAPSDNAETDSVSAHLTGDMVGGTATINLIYQNGKRSYMRRAYVNLSSNIGDPDIVINPQTYDKQGYQISSASAWHIPFDYPTVYHYGHGDLSRYNREHTFIYQSSPIDIQIEYVDTQTRRPVANPDDLGQVANDGDTIDLEDANNSNGIVSVNGSNYRLNLPTGYHLSHSNNYIKVTANGTYVKRVVTLGGFRMVRIPLMKLTLGITPHFTKHNTKPTNASSSSVAPMKPSSASSVAPSSSNSASPSSASSVQSSSASVVPSSANQSVAPSSTNSVTPSTVSSSNVRPIIPSDNTIKPSSHAKVNHSSIVGKARKNPSKVKNQPNMIKHNRRVNRNIDVRLSHASNANVTPLVAERNAHRTSHTNAKPVHVNVPKPTTANIQHNNSNKLPQTNEASNTSTIVAVLMLLTSIGFAGVDLRRKHSI